MTLAPISMLDSALEYARRGWPVVQLHHVTPDGCCSCRDGFDCGSPAKHPTGLRGLKEATINESFIQTSWGRDPKANVAILTGRESGLVALDVDGPEGEESLSQLEAEFGRLTTLTSITARGRHLLFRHPGISVGNAVKFRPGLDIRGDGGYIVAPPSVHATGTQYRWSDPAATVEPMPAWLLAALMHKNGNGNGNGRHHGNGNGGVVAQPDPHRFERARKYMEKRDPAIAGQGGDQWTFITAAYLVNEYLLSDEDAMILLREWNDRCVPPWSERDLQRKIQSARKNSKHEPGSRATSNAGSRPPHPAEQPEAYGEGRETRDNQKPAVDETWAPPLSLGEHQKLPTFPVESLPGWMSRFVESESRALQVPVDLCAMLGLSILALACAKKVRVLVKPGYSEPVNLWTVTALPAGERKSPSYSTMIRPVEDFERAEAKLMKPVISKAVAEKVILEKRLLNAQTRASKAKDDDDRHRWEQESIELSKQLVNLETPAANRLLAADTTPEKLVSLMAENLGRIAIVSAEGEIFEIMAGRYSKSGSSNIETFLKAHSGDNIRIDRMMRASEFVEDPALTLGLAVQPDVIRGLTRRREFRGRGLLARFLYALPSSLLGQRSVSAEPTPPDVRDLYHARVHALLSLPFATLPDDRCGPHELRLSEGARALLSEFEAWLEPRLGKGGKFDHMTDWAGKLAGTISRVAGLLHMATHAGQEQPWTVLLSAETMRHAIEVGMYAIAHARAAFDLMGVDPVLEDAKAILEWLDRRILSISRSGALYDDDDDDDDDVCIQGARSQNCQNNFSRRDVLRGMRRRFKALDAVDAPLRLLATHGYVRLLPAEDPGGRGRPAGPRYLVNPLYVEQLHQQHNTAPAESEEYVTL